MGRVLMWRRVGTQCRLDTSNGDPAREKGEGFCNLLGLPALLATYLNRRSSVLGPQKVVQNKPHHPPFIPWM